MAALRVLQRSLEEAQKNLIITDDTIRKVTGRDPNEPRPTRLSSSSTGVKTRDSRLRSADSYDSAIPAKRRRESFGRRHDQMSDEENDDNSSRKLSSSVQVTEVPPRPHGDTVTTDTKAKGKDRNRRMLGVLMGTLHQFKKEQEAIQQTGKDKRRQEIEQKLEREAQVEREEAAKTRKGLFQQRRNQQDEVTRLQKKLMMAEMVTEWDEHDKLLSSFIRTNSSPAIYYLPAHHNVNTIKCLQDSKNKLEAKMKDRQKEILDDNDDVMETDESLGSSNVVKSQVIITKPNKDIFEVGNDEGNGMGPEGKNSSRVCEVKPLPRDTDTTTLVSMEIISKGKQEELDNSSGEID